MKKFRTELTPKDAPLPSNDVEEEKNHSESPNKLLTNTTENIILESDNPENDIKEENLNNKKIDTEKQEQNEKNISLEIINLLEKNNQKMKMNLTNNINNTNKNQQPPGLNIINTQIKQSVITPTNKTQNKEKEENDDKYWDENLGKKNLNITPNQQKNLIPNQIPNQNQQIQNNAPPHVPKQYLTKRRRAELQEEYAQNSRGGNRRTNNINYTNQNFNNNSNNNNSDSGSKEKQILAKMIEQKGFLFIFNLLTKSNLNRNDQIEKYIDDLISNMGLLKLSLIIFQIYFETKINSEKQRALNKREDASDILIDIDIDNDIPGSNNNMPNNIYPSNNNNNRTNMNNYQTNNYTSINNNNQISNNNYNPMRNNNNNDINNIINSEPNMISNIAYTDPNETGNERNVSKYFNNNFSYDQKKAEPKKKDTNRLSFSLKSTGLSLHFHKDEIGNVYKYSKHHFFGKDICVFYCCDKECRATANYYMNTLRFVLVNKHSKEYSEHIFVKKPDRDRKVMDDLKKRAEHEGQMFKRSDGAKIVKWYDML